MWWLFWYAYNPLQAAMFAMLAFYVASAAFRAFRAKNTEATLLLATAVIVLLGQTYAGTWLTSAVPDDYPALTFPGVKTIILGVFNTAGQRAIMIGIALGVAATSLKVLLGMDRSYLGSDGE
jgi:di/tricarboxylate transporter